MFRALLVAGIGIESRACTQTSLDSEPAATSGAAGAGASPIAGAGSAAGGARNGTSGGGDGAAQAGTSGTLASAGGSAPATGGVAGSNHAGAGAGLGGASSAAVGCNWLKGADGSWSMNPPVTDRVVLFGGESLSQWHRLNEPGTPAQWKILADRTVQVVTEPTPTNIQSNAKFDDVCLHVEYMTPQYPSNAGVQQRGNSGIYLKSAYELQILDTKGLGPLIDGCGAVYKVSPPLEVACKQSGEWNVYDIEFKGSTWDAAGKKLKNASFAQVTLNGALVQQNVSLVLPGGLTEAGIPEVAGPQPISLQDHRDAVRFRNIWAAVPNY